MNHDETKLHVYVEPWTLVLPYDDGGSNTGTEQKWCPLWTNNGYREYKIRLEHQGQTLVETQMRFSVFHQRFSAVRANSYVCPPRSFWWENYTTDIINVSLRAKSMQSYLDAVLNRCGIPMLQSSALHNALELDDTARAHLLKVAQHRRSAQKAVEEREAAMRNERRRKAYEEERARQALELEMWNKAQCLNVTSEDSRTSLRFPVERAFEIHALWFTAGDETIQGPYQKAWFALSRTDFPQLNPFADSTYQLTTISGVPLLEMKQRFRALDFMYDLSYVTAPGDRVPAARVHRRLQFAFIDETYDITGLGANHQIHFQCDSIFGKTTIHVNGKAGASMTEHFFTMTNGHSVLISPQQDCLLILGICCAISRIHAAQKQSSNAAVTS